MLTAALRVCHWDRRTSSISSDRLEDETLPVLARTLAVYRARVGHHRGQVRNAARVALEGLRPDRVEPVVKLLDDVATYDRPSRAYCARWRVELFTEAAPRHPLLDPDDARPLLTAAIARPPRAAPAQVERPASAGAIDGGEGAVAQLYADYPEFHVLSAFPADYTARALRADYDLAQAQALLYAATRVVVDARADFKHVLRYARLARLLHRVEPGGRGYRFVLDGPNSVLRRTRAYGVDFARFLAALVRLRDWRLTAEIELRRGWRPFRFTLSTDDNLGGMVAAPPEFDSSLEETFALTFGREREGWRLAREAMVLKAGDSLIVPDFVFSHHDGTEVAMEIVGYWTPEYVADKLQKLADARPLGRTRRSQRPLNLLVAVPRRLGLRPGALPAPVITFGQRLRLRDVLPQLEAFRTGERGASAQGRPDASGQTP